MVFQMPMESFDPRCTLGDGIGESLRNMGDKPHRNPEKSGRTSGKMRPGKKNTQTAIPIR